MNFVMWEAVKSSRCFVTGFMVLYICCSIADGISAGELGEDTCYHCSTLTSIGPPPDTIIGMPPPPLPSNLRHLVLNNMTKESECNLCHILADNELNTFPALLLPIAKVDKSWVSVIILVAVSGGVIGTVMVIVTMKSKQWKNFRTSGKSCPVFPESLLNHKTVPHPSKDDGKDKCKTVENGHITPRCPSSEIDSCSEDSPVYAELDVELSSTKSNEAGRLLPGAAYENSAFFVSENGGRGRTLVPASHLFDNYIANSIPVASFLGQKNHQRRPLPPLPTGAPVPM